MYVTCMVSKLRLVYENKFDRRSKACFCGCEGVNKDSGNSVIVVSVVLNQKRNRLMYSRVTREQTSMNDRQSLRYMR